MTRSDCIARLTAAGIDDAAHDAGLLIEHVFGVSLASQYARPEEDYTSPALADALARRASGEPLGYILGEVGFYEETYTVSPACLIPRRDTERLVEEAIRVLPTGAHFLDLCTGSGCVAISVLAHRADCTATLVDVSEDALALARANAARNKVDGRASFLCADLLRASSLPAADAILSNPPYIRADVIDTLPADVQREPRIALDGGDDGLLFYRRLTALSHDVLARGGVVLYEIGYDQAEAIRAIADDAGCSCAILPDLEGRARVAHLQRAAHI